MSKQPEAAKPAHSESLLCKTGCGFFGKNSTGDCCSKCWALIRPKDGAPKEKENELSSVADTASTLASKASSSELTLVEAVTPLESIEEIAAAPQPTASMDVEVPAIDAVMEKTAPVASPAKKKKGKNASYKNMMAGMLGGNSTSHDVEKEKDKLRKVTGGGHFSKVDKI